MGKILVTSAVIPHPDRQVWERLIPIRDREKDEPSQEDEIETMIEKGED